MALSTSPTYPVAGSETVITETSALGDVQVIELTSAPSASTMTLGYQTTAVSTSPTSVFQIATQDIATDTVTFDERGEYGITIYDLRVFEGAPSFSKDPAGDRYAKLLSTFTYTLNVNGTVDLPILTERGDGATLRLTVNDTTVRAAEIVDPLTESSRVAALQSTVISALASLVGVAVTGLGDTLYSNVNDLRAKYELHRVDGTAHPAPAQDLTNVITLTNANSNEGAIILLNHIREKLINHIKNGTGAPVPWHTVDDLLNVPITTAASDLATATVLSADLRSRCYKPHEIQAAAPAVHPGAGNDPLKVPGVLDDAIAAYLDVLASYSLTVPAGEADGAITAEHLFGFRRSNP